MFKKSVSLFLSLLFFLSAVLPLLFLPSLALALNAAPDFPYMKLDPNTYEFLARGINQQGIVFKDRQGMEAAVNAAWDSKNLTQQAGIKALADRYASGEPVSESTLVSDGAGGVSSIGSIFAVFVTGYIIGQSILWTYNYFNPPVVVDFSKTHLANTPIGSVYDVGGNTISFTSAVDLTPGSASYHIANPNNSAAWWYVAPNLDNGSIDILFQGSFVVQKYPYGTGLGQFNDVTFSWVTDSQSSLYHHVVLIGYSPAQTNWRLLYDFNFSRTSMPTYIEPYQMPQSDHLIIGPPDPNYQVGVMPDIRPSTYNRPALGVDYSIIGKTAAQVNADAVANPSTPPAPDIEVRISLLQQILTALNPLTWLQLIYNAVVSVATGVQTVVSDVMALPAEIWADIKSGLQTLFEPQTSLSNDFNNVKEVAAVKLPFFNGMTGVFVGQAQTNLPIWKFPIRPPFYNTYVTIDFNDYSTWWAWSRGFLAVIIWFGCFSFCLRLINWGSHDDGGTYVNTAASDSGDS